MDIQNKSDQPISIPYDQLQFISSQAEEDFLLLLGALPLGCMLLDTEFRIKYWNAAAKRFFGYSSQEVVGRNPSGLIFLDEASRQFDQIVQKLGVGYVQTIDLEGVSKDGIIRFSKWRFIRLRTNPPSLLAMMNDSDGAISPTNDGVQRHKDRIHALRTIDTAISGSMDFQVTLSVVLQQMMAQLKMDAAIILVYEPMMNVLKFAAGRGLRTDALRYTALRIGEGFAGMAALEKRVIQVPSLKHAQQEFSNSPRFSSEGFESYYCVPLIAKGEVKGVMESFHRTPFRADSEWLDFFETLGGQAAIAIDNAMMFSELQRSNLELMLAYDSTLEGWSRALDLRDRDTEGHTRRVTEMTLRLVLEFNISEADHIHIRRGAILHDIGKMGIPDTILLKEGPLSEEEWMIMRQHPLLAMEMLSGTAYLRPALDIPQSHHEKWDGSGYPRGLKGGQIPLAARIFAVVDVFDALTSDRPYRRAWPVGQALEYIHSESGKHFDPDVVSIFMRVIGRLGALARR